MKVRTVLAVVLGIIAGATSALGGAQLAVRSHASKPIALVGVAVGNRFEGVVVITGDGIIHAEPDLPYEASTEIAKALGSGHAMLIHIPDDSQGT